MISVYEALQGKSDNLLKEDEYRNESGVICCKKCHAPRQIMLPVEGKLIYPRVLCLCQREERERLEAERKARIQREEIQRNRSVGIPDPVLQKHTFENSQGFNQEAMRIARSYCKRWDTLKAESLGLCFWGDVGTGKTYIAGCIANDLLDRGVRVLMTNFSRLLNRLTDLQMGDRNSYIDSLNVYELLVIDDFGIERNSEFAKEQCFSIVDSRYRSGLPMIVTTNLTLEDMKHPDDLWRKRIFDRIQERCIPVCVNDQNIRGINRARALERGRELLLTEST